MSNITVSNIQGHTSGADANKVSLASTQTLDVNGTLDVTGATFTGAGVINTANIADDAITAAKIADSVVGSKLVGYYSPSSDVSNFDITLSATDHDFYRVVGFLNNGTSGVNPRLRFFNSSGTIQTGSSDYHYSRFKIENSATGVETNNDESHIAWAATAGHSGTNRKGLGFEMLIGPTNSTVFPVQMQGMTTLHDENSNISLNIFGGGYMDPASTFGGIRLYFSSGNVEDDSFVYVYGMNKT